MVQEQRTLVTIADRPDLVPTVARWRWHEFGRDFGRTLEQAEARVAASVSRSGPPQTFVLLLDGEPVGTASLTATDLDERPDLTPWLASVYVVPEQRGHGHAAHLVAAVEEACRAASIASLWLYTNTAERVYARAGWRTAEVVQRDGKRPVTLMRRDLGDAGPAKPTGPAMLRPARPEDAPAIAVVWYAGWHASHASLSPPEVVAFRGRSWFADRAADLVPRACVAERAAGALVGFSAWREEELRLLFVTEEEYGSGTAASLLARAEAALAGQGARTAFLICRAGNGRAARFYGKHGWHREGTFTQELQSTQGPRGVETWRMVKQLPA